MLGVLVHCIDKVLRGEGLEPFKLGNVPIPKFLRAGASYQDALILMIVAVQSLMAGLFFRWRYYRLEDDFKNKYKIKDKSSFADKLIEDFRKNDKF